MRIVAAGGLGLFLIASLPMPSLLAAQASVAGHAAGSYQSDLLARGGGGGSFGGGGARGGGGGGSFGGGANRTGGGFSGGGAGAVNRGQSGFGQAGGGLDRGSSPPTGGWSNRTNPGAGAGPSLNRPSNIQQARPNGGNRDINAGNRTGNRDFNSGNRVGDGVGNGVGNRDVNAGNRVGNRGVNINGGVNVNRQVNRNWSPTVNRTWNANPGWARPGWGMARPWATGWYGGWASPSWGWWGARAAVWGVATLTTAAVINSAVNSAIDDHVEVIVVPNTNYQLLYGTVQPSGSSSVSFVVQADGNSYQLTADCNQGLLNGQQPQSVQEAELLNAACQVAYGSV